MAIAIAEKLGLFGTVAIVDINDKFMYGVMYGNARPMTKEIAKNKAAQAAYTGARTSTIAQQIASDHRTLELYGLKKEVIKLKYWIVYCILNEQRQTQHGKQ